MSGLALLLMSVGCSDSGNLVGLVKCEGTVTYNGSPLADAMLTFHPDGGGSDARAAGASADSSGKFEVTTLKSEDAIGPGNYKVKIVKFEEYGELPSKVANDDGEMVQPARPQKNTLPKKYENPNSSGLTATIEKGNKATLTFVLVD